ncbi:hypothetical protein PENSPDRAFT_758391 [Peniophora sp. CONT]|nr:hypothetical protein PENSPDRAFT_758391 [Peniophora sp. CONT]
MAAVPQPSISPTDNCPPADDRKQSLLAFLNLADSAARLGTNMPDVAALASDDVSPGFPANHAQLSLDIDHLAHLLGANGSDELNSVPYALGRVRPICRRLRQQGNRAEKSLPASRRHGASEHDEELAAHLHNLSLVGQESVSQRHSRLDGDAAILGAFTTPEWCSRSS